MENLNLSIDEINKMYEDEYLVLKAIGDEERKIEEQVTAYLLRGTGSRWKICKELTKIIKRYEEEIPKCKQIPYRSGLIMVSIYDEIKRIVSLIGAMYSDVN